MTDTQSVLDTLTLAWKAIQAKLPEARATAYTYVAVYPGSTAKELEVHAGSADLHKRLSELEKMGVVAAAGERVCSITHQKAVVWVIVNPAQVSLKATFNRGPTRQELLTFHSMYETWAANPTMQAHKDLQEKFAAIKAKL